MKTTIKCHRLSHLPFADKPLLQGGIVKNISTECFEQYIGQTYSDSIIIDEQLLADTSFQDNVIGNVSVKALSKKFTVFLNQTEQNLVICKMNESIAYGVFASKDIPKNTVICFESGTLTKTNTINSRSDNASQYYNSSFSFSTRDHRGMSSFFKHLPNLLKFKNPTVFSNILRSAGQNVSVSELLINEELYSIAFNDLNAQKTLALANVRREYICYENFPVILLVTDRDIRFGEQLGYNYGKDYWLSRKQVPHYFNLNGSIIDPTAYLRTFHQLSFSDSNYTGELLPLINQLRQGNKQISLQDDDKCCRVYDSVVVAKLLFQIRAIHEHEYHEFTGSNRVYESNHKSSSNTYPIQQLAKKYNLLFSSSSEFERGLRNAAVNNQLEDVKQFILINNININAADSNPKVKRTALHWAAAKKHSAIYLELKNAGALENIPDAHGKTAAELFTHHEAAITGRPNITCI